MALYYDRFTGRQIKEDMLPRDIDLGRFQDENGRDLTNRVFSAGSERYIHQELLDENNSSTHEIFGEILKRVIDRENGDFSVYPTIQCMDEKLKLTDFEKLLIKRVEHFGYICHQPHFLLQRTIEKVSVSKAKRIPSKSYQYLASHTEDWEQKSIVRFKPNRILNEELDVNFNVYENQLTLALINRCLRYVDGRIRGVKKYRNVLEKYEGLKALSSDLSSAWYEKVHRNFDLVGGSMQSYQEKFMKTLSETEESLLKIRRELLRCKTSPLFDEVDERVTTGITFHDTNVLVNHKHYRYVKELWVELNKVRPEKNDEEKKYDEQQIIEGLRVYAKVLIAYCVTHMSCITSNHELEGSYDNWDGIHDKKASISLRTEADKTITLMVGRYSLRFIVTGNPVCDRVSLPSRTFILYYSEDEASSYPGGIRIDPVDPDSSERIGALINKYLLAEYVGLVQKSYKFPHELRDFVKYINAPWIGFDTKGYTYSFLRPGTELRKENISSELKVGTNIRDDQKKALHQFVLDINRNYDAYIRSNLYCFHCLSPINLHILDSFSYLVCRGDGFVLDISTPGTVTLKNDDEKYDGQVMDWGLDCCSFNLREL